MRRKITSGNRRILQSDHRYCCWSSCYFQLVLLSKIKRTSFVTSSRCPTKRKLGSFTIFTYHHVTVLWQSNGTYGSDKVMKPSSFHFNFMSKQIIEEFINTGPFKGFSLRIHAIFRSKASNHSKRTPWKAIHGILGQRIATNTSPLKNWFSIVFAKNLSAKTFRPTETLASVNYAHANAV